MCLKHLQVNSQTFYLNRNKLALQGMKEKVVSQDQILQTLLRSQFQKIFAHKVEIIKTLP